MLYVKLPATSLASPPKRAWVAHRPGQWAGRIREYHHS